MGDPPLGWGSMLHCVDHVACYMLHSKDPPSIGVGSHVALCESVLHRKFPLCGLVSMCELFVRGTIWYHVAWGPPPHWGGDPCCTVWIMLHCVDHVACYMLHSKDPPSIG